MNRSGGPSGAGPSAGDTPVEDVEDLQRQFNQKMDFYEATRAVDPDTAAQAKKEADALMERLRHKLR